jgi:Flp pilus assembly protein TadD
VGRREFADLTDAWAESLIEDCYDPYQLSVAAAVAHFRGENATATQRLERAIALSEAPAPYHRQLGKLLLGEGELVGARSNLEQAAVLDPTDADTWVLLVNMLEKTDRAEAYRKVNAGLVKCPESWALHLAYGRMLSADGQPDRAVPQLQEAKRLRPSEVNSYVELALAYFKRGAVEEGVDEMKQALVVQPDHPLALVVMARDAVSRGDEAGARAWLRRIKLQTRVRAEDVQAVAAEFREKFGQLP